MIDEMTKLTTVKLISEMYKKFRVITLDDEFTLQKLVNRSVDKYLLDEEFRKEIQNYNNLEQSGSRF